MPTEESPGSAPPKQSRSSLPVVRTTADGTPAASPDRPSEVIEFRKTAPLTKPTSSEPSLPDLPLPTWRRLMLSGGGASLVAVAIAGHLAVPIAIPSVVIGSGLFALGLAFNRGIKSLSLSPQDGLKANAEDVNQTIAIIDDAASLTERRLALVRHWTGSLQRINSDIDVPGMTYADAAIVIADFIRGALADLTQELKTVGETIRASLWLLEPSGDLHFVLGNEIANPGLSFRPGSGIIGRAFITNQIWNVPNGPKRPEYVGARPDEPFSGLLCIPLSKGRGKPSGVLCVDRTQAFVFPATAVDTACTLGSIIMTALANLEQRVK